MTGICPSSAASVSQPCFLFFNFLQFFKSVDFQQHNLRLSLTKRLHFKKPFSVYVLHKGFRTLHSLSLSLSLSPSPWFSGELGWELHCPTEHTARLYRELMERGKEFGVHPFGSFAMNSLRMEKGFRSWPEEVNCTCSIFSICCPCRGNRCAVNPEYFVRFLFFVYFLRDGFRTKISCVRIKCDRFICIKDQQLYENFMRTKGWRSPTYEN